jgi:hypothetical protein
MNKRRPRTKKLLGNILRRSLERGASFQIEGLGTFLPTEEHSFRFVPEDRPRVFIAYVQEDLPRARKLSDDLEAAGYDAWLDKRKLLPGQNWPRAIENAIGSADFFVACFSRRSVGKRGMFHSELRFALECGARIPLDESFFIPVRLDACLIPASISNTLQYVDLFPDWNVGLERVLKMMGDQQEVRQRKLLPLAG